MDKLWIRVSLLYFLMGFGLWACSSDSGKTSDVAGFFDGMPDIDIERLHNQLANELLDSAAIDEYLESTELPEELHQPYLDFYISRDYRPAWVDAEGLTTEALEFLQAVMESPSQGLSTEDYKLQYLYHLKKKLENEDSGLNDYQKIEKELTGAYLKLANHILRGRIDPQQIDTLWISNRREKDLAQHLQEAITEGEIRESLEALEPQYKGYKGLKEALQHYEAIVADTQEWEKLSEDLELKPGDSSEWVPQLAEMLHALGDKEGAPKADAQLFDEELASALAVFQQRHGLEPDSVLASNTIKELNISPKNRLSQIKLNLERYRWMPERPEGTFVMVNLPEYMLYMYEGEDSTFSMRVIVGKAFESTTPVFNDTIEYITFSPTWTVPERIAVEEMLPALLEDPDYLRDRNFKLYEGWTEGAEELDARDIKWKKVDKKDEFTYRIVQQPGENNSLGKVKFMFPNPLDIYLHDTPADYLFGQNERDFSHGCIRVEKPAEFARLLLHDKGWDEQKIDEYMHKEEPTDVSLPEKIPIMLEYRTAWMGLEGKVQFREDIYGHDRTQSARLEQAAEDPAVALFQVR